MLYEVITVVTDTRMAACGIPCRRLVPFGGRVVSFVDDDEVAREAKRRGLTRSHVAAERAASLEGPVIWAVGNAPTALLRLMDLMDEGRARPALIVGMPVGFVNAAQSKDLLMARGDVPYITIEGRKGGSALAACTVITSYSIHYTKLYEFEEGRLAPFPGEIE